QIGRHRQQSPDQDFSKEAAPEFRQHHRRYDEQRHYNAKAKPENDSVAQLGPHFKTYRFVEWRGSHFGVGTNRPVGRNSSVRMRMGTIKDPITACAGLTQIEA